MSAKDEIRRNTEEVQGPAAIANSGSAGVSGAFAVMASEDFHRPGEASWSVDEIRYDEIERDRIRKIPSFSTPTEPELQAPPARYEP
jgi:hypothetical protein